MSGNIKFRWFLLTVVALLVVVSSSVISSAGELEDEVEAVAEVAGIKPYFESFDQSKILEQELENAQIDAHLNPNDAQAHYDLGYAYRKSGRYQDAIAASKEAIRIKPDFAEAHYELGIAYNSLGRY